MLHTDTDVSHSGYSIGCLFVLVSENRAMLPIVDEYKHSYTW